jgi:electron transfer flavoprotein beta subunit
VILFGKHAIGVDNGQVSSVVADQLDLPQVSVVVKLDIQDGAFRAEREIEGAREIMDGTLPAVFTAQKGLNTPRYASLKGIMAAKKKTIEIKTLELLGLTPDDLRPRLSIEQITLPPSRPPGRVLTGDLSETVPMLVKLLHEEAKVI